MLVEQPTVRTDATCSAGESQHTTRSAGAPHPVASGQPDRDPISDSASTSSDDSTQISDMPLSAFSKSIEATTEQLRTAEGEARSALRDIRARIAELQRMKRRIDSGSTRAAEAYFASFGSNVGYVVSAAYNLSSCAEEMRQN